MDIIKELAFWSGWAPIVLILLLLGSFGAWLFTKQIDILKGENEALNQRLQENKDFTPDVVARRLAERHKLLSQELEIAEQDQQMNVNRISELETQLSATRMEADSLRSQMGQVVEILNDLQRPRDSIIREDLVQDILKTVPILSAIFVPITIEKGFDQEILSRIMGGIPYKIVVDYPGMSKMYLLVYDCKRNFIGQVANPYFEIYDKDYFGTLLHVFETAKSPDIVYDTNEQNPSYVLVNSSFHAISPVNSGIFYIKIPFDQNQLVKFSM